MRGVDFYNPLQAGIRGCRANRFDEPVRVIAKNVVPKKERAVPEDVGENDGDFPVGRQAQLLPRHFRRKDCFVELSADRAEPILRFVAREKLLPNLVAIFRIPRDRADAPPRFGRMAQRVIAFIAEMISLESEEVALIAEIPGQRVDPLTECQIKDLSLA